LLSDNSLNAYEISAGRWVLSIAGLWLVNNSEKIRDHELIDTYQLKRRRYFEALKIKDPPETFSERFK
jgi:hypothetical protein